MGCDIHLKLEMRKIGKTYMMREKFDDSGITEEVVESPHYDSEYSWEPVELTSNGCWSDRVYGMFAKLADVRNHFLREIKPIPQRGFPDDACNCTKTAYTYIVVPDEKYEENRDYYEISELSYVSESEANDWVKDGFSKEFERFGNMELRRIVGPDWHSPNWCTTKEMEDCINEIFWREDAQQWIGDYIEWFALLGAMKGIEQNGAYECRAVFWFDN